MAEKKEHVCPWWLGYLLCCPLRRFPHNPQKILAPYVHEGMAVLEPGPGMGFFTLDLLRMVGNSGCVVAVDVQPKMLDRLRRRAEKKGIASRLDARLAAPDSMGLGDLAGKVDFTLAFAVVHEFPSADGFFAQVAAASKPGAVVLFAEPRGHVSDQAWARELDSARKAGFSVESSPAIKRSHAAVLRFS